MIDQIDVALRTLVQRDFPSTGDIAVAFDAPSREWAARRSQTTVGLYLYDLRQEASHRETGVRDVVGSDGFVTARGSPPVSFRLSYLVTVWTQRPEDEHRLLGSLLARFLRHRVLPADVVGGALGALGVDLPLSVALPPDDDRSVADLWSALGGELKPSIDLRVVAPIVPEDLEPTATPVQRRALHLGALVGRETVEGLHEERRELAGGERSVAGG